MSDAESPVLRVVRGTPSAEELAIVAALVAAAGNGVDETAPAPTGRWNDPAMLARRSLHHGPGAWRSTFR